VVSHRSPAIVVPPVSPHVYHVVDGARPSHNLHIGVYRQYPSEYRYRGADKSLARPGRKQATATEDFEFHISYL
jgi:hypothetical protein